MKYFIKVLKKIGCLKYFNINILHSVNGKQFKIPLLGNLGYSHLHDFEPWMQELLAILLPLSQGTFVDVGSNVGQVLLKLRSIDEERPYLGLEPNSSCIHYLSKLISKNNFHNTSTLPVGLHTETGIAQLSFYENTDEDSCATIIEDFRNFRDVVKQEHVALMTAQKALKNTVINKISILKIDVEGSESLVLESFKEQLKQYRPIIILEILPVDENDSAQHWTYQKNTVTLLQELDYTMFKIIHKKGFKGLKIISNYSVDNDEYLYDYLFVPQSLTKELSKYNYEL